MIYFSAKNLIGWAYKLQICVQLNANVRKAGIAEMFSGWFPGSLKNEHCT